MTDRDEVRVAKALQGADFPADRASLVRYAEQRQADAETMQALSALPDGTYESVQYVIQAVPKEPEGDRPGGTER